MAVGRQAITLKVADMPIMQETLRRAVDDMAQMWALILQANDALSCALSTPQCPSRDPVSGDRLPWYQQAIDAENAIRRYLAAQQPQQGGE